MSIFELCRWGSSIRLDIMDRGLIGSITSTVTVTVTYLYHCHYHYYLHRYRYCQCYDYFHFYFFSVYLVTSSLIAPVNDLLHSY